MTTELPAPAPWPTMPGADAALATTLGVGVVATVLAAVVADRAAVLGAAVGVAVVCGFFLFGALNTRLAAAYSPKVSMFVALLTYTVQVVVLWLVLVAISRSGLAEDRLDVRWVGATVVAGTLGWTAALVGRALRGEVRR